MSNLLQNVIYRVSQNYKYGYTSGKFVSCVLLCYYMHFFSSDTDALPVCVLKG